ncbi:hypothetical protein Goarm_012356 [Gossypium armourianum]|uniref:Reverse transcriptase zinc-binding domain-containing protein n=1 Tax=Gossypium armourianum TaxID=34283 RepID=A0A7J9J166_9ROSI|nr:hypothetical protein [Gossypium armourianum]
MEQLRVSNLLIDNADQWDAHLVEHIISPYDADSILKLPILSTKPNDPLIWHFSRTGISEPQEAALLILLVHAVAWFDSIKYVLLECAKVVDIWHCLGITIDFHIVTEFLQFYLAVANNTVKHRVMAVARSLWFPRNLFVWKNTDAPTSKKNMVADQFLKD